MLAFDAQGDDEESSLQNLGNGFTSKLPPGYLTHGLPTVKDVAPAITPLEIKKETEVKKEGESPRRIDIYLHSLESPPLMKKSFFHYTNCYFYLSTRYFFIN